jgi:hypothetical protein
VALRDANDFLVALTARPSTMTRVHDRSALMNPILSFLIPILATLQVASTTTTKIEQPPKPDFRNPVDYLAWFRAYQTARLTGENAHPLYVRMTAECREFLHPADEKGELWIRFDNAGRNAWSHDHDDELFAYVQSQEANFQRWIALARMPGSRVIPPDSARFLGHGWFEDTKRSEKAWHSLLRARGWSIPTGPSAYSMR